MIRVLSLNLQHGLPGAGAGDGSASTGSLAGADISDPATARAVMRATAEQIAELARVHTETVNKYGAACSGFVCDNAKLKDFIASKADASAAAQYKQKIAEAREANLSDKDAKSVVLEKDKQNAIDESADSSGRRMILIAAIALVVAIAAFLIIRRRRKN